VADLEAAVWDALRDVLDPETELNLVDLGLIYDVTVEDGAVAITMTFTTAACPAGPLLTGLAEAAVRSLPSVCDVRIEVTFDPPWTPERISAAGRAQLAKGHMR
jgi:metal-sulfur cluster biosynthetic enzyme